MQENIIYRGMPKDQTSGIYICILESDNYFKVEKLLLLK